LKLENTRKYSWKWSTITLLILLGAALFLDTIPYVSAVNYGLDAANLSFQTGWSGTGSPWSEEYTDWVEGGSACQSGSLYTGDPDYPSYSYIRTSVYGPGHLYFWWKVSCLQGDSRLILVVAGPSSEEAVYAGISGELDWGEHEIYIPPGYHSLEWRFVKGYLNGGANAGWLDNVRWVPTSPVLIVRGANNEVFYREIGRPSDVLGGSWVMLQDGSTCDSPAAGIQLDTFDWWFIPPGILVRGTTSMVTVVRGMDGKSLYWGRVNLEDPNRGFSGWSQLDGETMSAPTLVSNGTCLCLVVRGLDNRIYYRFYQNWFYGWTDWTVIPDGFTCDSPAAALIGNELRIVTRGMDGSSLWWEITRTTDNTVITPWELIPGGTTPSRPFLVAAQDRYEYPNEWPTMNYLVVRGMNNGIFTNYLFTGYRHWSNHFGQLDGSTIDGPAAWWWWDGWETGNYLHIVVRDITGNQLWHRRDHPESSWSLVDGMTPSAPTVAWCF
jgi:hypothetical protein